MSYIVKAWTWLSGKKTVVGATILLVAQGIEIWTSDVPQVVEMLRYVGAAIAGVGIGHKLVK